VSRPVEDNRSTGDAGYAEMGIANLRRLQGKIHEVVPIVEFVCCYRGDDPLVSKVVKEDRVILKHVDVSRRVLSVTVPYGKVQLHFGMNISPHRSDRLLHGMGVGKSK